MPDITLPLTMPLIHNARRGPRTRPLLAFTASLIALFYALWPGRAPASAAAVLDDRGGTARFPAISGSNLEDEVFNLPGDFGGQYNVVMLAYLQYHQFDVNTWVGFLKALRAQYPISVYELPVLGQYAGWQQDRINAGMRYGIPDIGIRRTTITLYTDIAAFNRALGLPGTNSIYVLLVDREGRVYWKARGPYSDESGQSLRAMVAALYAQRDVATDQPTEEATDQQ